MSWLLVPAAAVCIAVTVEQVENWLLRRDRRARRDGRRDVLEWQARRD